MKNYFKKLENVSIIRFIVTLTIIAFIAKIPTGILGAYLVRLFDISNPLFSASQQEPTFTGDDMFLAIVFAPLIETLIAQLIPLEIMSHVTKSKTILVGTSATLFMLMHFPVVEFFPSAFVVGLVFAWAWVVKRHLGLGKTFLIVALIHSMHNALVAAFAALIL